MIHFGIILAPLFIILLIAVISIAESFPTVFPPFLSNGSRKFNDCVWLRRIAGYLTILLLTFSNLGDMVTSPEIFPITVRGHLNESFVSEITYPTRTCIFPSYFSNYAVLILIAASIVSQLSHISKIVLMTLITGKFIFHKINYSRLK